MLAPTINDAKERLTDAYAGVLALDGFSQSVSSIQVVKLPEDPDWLPPVRGELGALRDDAGAWSLKRAGIWAPVLVSVVDYAPSVQALANQARARGEMSSAQWIELLETVLLKPARGSLADVTGAEAALSSRRAAFSAVLPQIDRSIAEGWGALGAEEVQMTRLAEEIGGLQQLASSYGAKLDSDAISTGKTIATTAVKMLYAAGAAGTSAAIPVLGIGVAVLTIGKSFYDLIEDNEKIIKTMQRISALQAQMSAEAQALALTKATLMVLYDIEKQYLAARDALPAVIDMWKAEVTKVEDAVNALQAGAQPDQYLDLLTLDAAATNWSAILDFADRLAHADIAMGLPVTLDIGKGTITSVPAPAPEKLLV